MAQTGPCQDSEVLRLVWHSSASMLSAGEAKVKNSCDGQPLAPYAAKLPAWKRSGDPSTDRVRQLERDAFQRIVDQLCKHPQYILPVQQILMNEDLIMQHRGSSIRGEWTGNYKTLANIPISWKLNFLESRSKSKN
eukprot:8081947-Lingulodinium_polyedra.AAC.1